MSFGGPRVAPERARRRAHALNGSKETTMPCTKAFKRVASMCFVGFVALACGEMGGFGAGQAGANAIGDIACPELRGGAMNASFDADARANATIRAFVTAAGDLATVASKAE